MSEKKLTDVDIAEHIGRAEKYIAIDEELRQCSPGIGLSYAVLTMQGLLAVIAHLSPSVGKGGKG